MNDTSSPARDIKAGDKIEHDLLPGFVMAVREVKPCETDGDRSQVHDQFLVTDPEGNDDWLCGYDVSPVSAK
jgi:hypothetical protein